MEAIKEFIKPELLIIIPVLYIIGKILKNTKLIADKHIPLALGIISIVLSTIYIIGNSNVIDAKSVLESIFIGITQGILCAGVSVYVNQIAEVQPRKKE
ncbi:phage holin family protein [Sedimentibacter sp. zth1]|uniref:phage holin family protein n=1 Tax=Sedimentibacter sp. zth1 TaxID=2816908 RepID=UPI001A928D8B|nr:phage holin family protein [Sedimentibacter sp. zth1]QSX05091.1 phage holin family protein [Sedimentibacter sp. zth1]